MVFINPSSMTALRTLRGAETALSNTQQRISTGLKVASPKDNPAFFLVAAQTRADTVFLEGIRENLNYGLGAIRTAQAAQDQLVSVIDNVTAAIIQLETGDAREELGRVIQEQTDIVRDVIQNTSFNGVNLLADDQVESFGGGLIRGRDGTSFPQIQVQGIGLGVDFEADNGLVNGDFENGTTGWTLGGGRVDHRTNFTNFGFRPFDGDSYISFGGGQQVGGQVSQTFATTAGVEYVVSYQYGASAAANLQELTVTADGTTNLETQVVNDVGTIPVSYEEYTFSFVADSATTTLTFNDTSINSNNTDGLLDAVTVTAVGGNISDGNFTSASLVQLLEVADPLTNDNFSTEVALRALNAARSRVSAGFSSLGAAERQIENRQRFIDGLTDSLEEGVAALVEADLAEESARLQADQVRRELAAQSLTISNGRPNLTLQLFR